MINPMERAAQLCGEDNEIIFLVKFGSHLYGTSSELSDDDYKGIFIPSLERCILGTSAKSYQTESGKKGEKNKPGDVDMQLWSIQYWFHLIAKGDTNALDLLYATSNEDCVIHKTPMIDYVVANHHKMYNVADLKGYIGYVVNQAAKYGLKGSRLGVVKRVHNHLEKFYAEGFDYDEKTRLSDINYQELLDKFGEKSYFFYKVVNDKPSLILCSKVHNLEIRLYDFIDRVKREYDKYGSRAADAEANNGIDWKALSHAIRAIHQMIEIIENERIVFPLKTADEIMDVKFGKKKWSEVETLIVDGLEDIKNRLELHKGKEKDRKFIRETILLFYNK